MKNNESRRIYSKEEVRELELSGFINPIRKVTLIDGSHVHIDRVTGITCSLEDELQKEEERMEKYRQQLKIKYQLQDLYQQHDLKNQEEN